MAITWISWGAAPGYINTAPLGLKGSCLNYKSFSKSPICSLLEYNNNKYKTALSRFLKTGEEPTTDFEQLQDWVNEQDSFKSAGYFGKPDDKHKEFYAAFKTWFNPLNSSQSADEEGNGEKSSSWVWLVLAVLFMIVVVVIGREVWLHAERAPSILAYEDDDEIEEGIQKPGLFDQLKQKTVALIGNQTTKPSNDVSKKELKSLRNESANNVQPLENRVTQSEKKLANSNNVQALENCITELEKELQSLRNELAQLRASVPKIPEKFEKQAKQHRDKFIRESQEITAQTPPRAQTPLDKTAPPPAETKPTQAAEPIQAEATAIDLIDKLKTV
jgi:ElaB/YqjD/DUF883 family membrane-anchored ribosome-binding protein